ncbi:MAG: ABC transporter permease [Deltaproteobacteria bacterium]|nr:ABC transporter permease [Deltaproteobacteria bacterium]
MTKREPFFWITVSCGIIVLAFILLPLIEMLSAPSAVMLKETLKDKDVVRSIWLSMYTALAAACISFVFGTPLAYVLARTNFHGKRLVESIIDLPIVIPHPVVGIAILSVAGKNHWLGQIMSELGVRIMGSVTGIITVLTFVGIPFYINAAKDGFEGISPRLENVARSLGAPMFSTFFRITFPLAWRSMLVGLIMCCARAISEFGAVVIVAYHPMIAPVMIYERFESYGLKYSQPVAVWLVLVCLSLFLILRILALPKKNRNHD